MAEIRKNKAYIIWAIVMQSEVVRTMLRTSDIYQKFEK